MGWQQSYKIRFQLCAETDMHHIGKRNPTEKARAPLNKPLDRDDGNLRAHYTDLVRHQASTTPCIGAQSWRLWQRTAACAKRCGLHSYH